MSRRFHSVYPEYARKPPAIGCKNRLRGFFELRASKHLDSLLTDQCVGPMRIAVLHAPNASVHKVQR